MYAPLRNPVYRRLFAAQLLSLLGTGLATVALGLLAFRLAGADAGVVLGTALAIKMVAYVGVAPIAGAFAHRLPRRALLVGLDLIRAGIAALLPFVTEIWQVYVLVAALQTCSAAFTPCFQATIPDVLPDEADYTRALSLARLAYDLESLASPVVAAALLSVVGFTWLFGGTALGFLASAGLVLSVALPSPQPPDAAEGAWGRITRGARICLATPRLCGLLALNLAVAAAGAMVIVNTVVIVRDGLGLDDRALALTLAAHGAGSMAAALLLPGLFDRGLGERAAMLAGAALLALGMAAGPFCGGGSGWGAVLALWAGLGFGNGLVLTPTGRLLRRSALAGDRPALFAAQFALSHACWLLTYPLAGLLGAAAGMPATFAAMAVLAASSAIAAASLWPRDDPAEIEHDHVGLAHDHPHLAHHAAIPVAAGRFRHRHAFIIDADHPRWPRPGRGGP